MASATVAAAASAALVRALTSRVTRGNLPVRRSGARRSGWPCRSSAGARGGRTPALGTPARLEVAKPAQPAAGGHLARSPLLEPQRGEIAGELRGQCAQSPPLVIVQPAQRLLDRCRPRT